MSVDYQNGVNGVVRTYVFQEGGETTRVNRGNVDLYVQYMAQFYLQESIRQSAKWIERGIRDVLGQIDFSLFDGVLNRVACQIANIPATVVRRNYGD